MPRLRFFVSYAREDREFAEILVCQLRAGRHHVWFDEMLVAGWQFTEEIQKNIQRCHFFMPVISPNSLASVWVQQEIGYALACNVPVVPAVFGKLLGKGGMIGGIQHIVAREPVDQDQLKKQLHKNSWDRLLRHAQERSLAVFQCNSDDTEKSRLIIKGAQEVADEFKNITVMQRSTLTSFSLPEQFEDKNWESVLDSNSNYEK